MSELIVKDAIDFHSHPIKAVTSVKDYYRGMKEAGVSKSVLLAMDLKTDILDTNKKIREKTIDTLYAASFLIDIKAAIKSMESILKLGYTSNREVAQWVKKDPDKFIGFGSVNPRDDKKVLSSKLDEIIDLNLRGIKLIPTLQFFNPKKNKNIKKIFSTAKKNNLMLLIHVGADPGPWELPRMGDNTNPLYWQKWIKKFNSDVTVIFAHLGGYGSRYGNKWLPVLLKMCQQYPNIYLDTAAVPNRLNDANIVKQIRKNCNFDKILFGSDYPVLMHSSIWHSKFLIEQNSHLKVEEKIKILRDNALQILGE